MVDPTDDRVLRVFLAKKISLLPDDIMRGILVRDNQEEPNFVVWYNDELRANGFPFSMHYTEKNNQKRYLRKITDTPEISYRLSYMI